MGFLHRGIAQLVEQRSPKPRAEGSNPSTPAKSTAVVIQMYRKTAVFFVCGSIRWNPKGFKENKLEKIIVMAPGHELWDGTIAFAAGCPWKAAFLGQRRGNQTILKITKELLWPCAMMTRRLSAHLSIGMKCQENMAVGLDRFFVCCRKIQGEPAV